MEPRQVRVQDIHTIDTNISCVWCPPKKDHRREDITITQQAGKALDTAAGALLSIHIYLHSLHTQGVQALSNLHESLNSGCDCGPCKCWYFTLSCISLGAFNTSIQKRKIPNYFFTKQREVWAILRSWGESRSIALPQPLPFLNNSWHCFRFHRQSQTFSSDTLG